MANGDWLRRLALGLVLTVSVGSCHLIARIDELLPRRASNGYECTSDDDCNSGYCVDLVCCASECEPACRACNVSGLEGSCNPLPPGFDPEAGCLGVCDGLGSCATTELVTTAVLGDGTRQSASALAIDPLDRILVAGTYQGTLDLGAASPPGNPGDVAFVTRFNTNGGLPSAPFGPDLSAIDPETARIVVDETGGLVVAGNRLDDSIPTLYAPDRWEGPVVLDAEGSVRLLGLAALNGGRILLSGRYDGRAHLGEVLLPKASPGAFLAVVDDAGSLVAVRPFHDEVTLGPSGVAVDVAAERIYLAVNTHETLRSGDLELYRDPLELEDEAPIEATVVVTLDLDLNVLDVFNELDPPGVPLIARLKADRLVFAWPSLAEATTVLKGISLVGDEPWTDTIIAEVAALDTDDDSVIVAGRVVLEEYFAGQLLGPIAGRPTAFVASYSPNGARRWATSIAVGLARSVALDHDGQVAVVGDYTGSLDLDVGNATSTLDDDGFVLKLSSDGKPLWHRGLGSSDDQTVTAITNVGNSFAVGGTFDRALTIGAGKPLIINTEKDAFVALLNPGLASSWVSHVEATDATILDLAGGMGNTSYVLACMGEGPLRILDNAGKVNFELATYAGGPLLYRLDGSGKAIAPFYEVAPGAPCDAGYALDVQLREPPNAPRVIVAGLHGASEPIASVVKLTNQLKKTDDKALGLGGNEEVQSVNIFGETLVVSGVVRQDVPIPTSRGFIRTYAVDTLAVIEDELYFPATKVLTQPLASTVPLADDQVATIIATDQAISVDGIEGKVTPGAVTTFYGLFTLPKLELESLVTLQPMFPLALGRDQVGNVVLTGELTSDVTWLGETVEVDNREGFVVKIARDGAVVDARLVRGEGTERLLAFSPGSADNDNIVVGGWFDGSVELDEGEGFFGNGVDGLILQLDLANP
ncbi:MAG: hypothetical protein KC731_23130 [Myxococcales bacterium]|nr:hypothetical protein [Myxococcales bacterium]